MMQIFGGILAILGFFAGILLGYYFGLFGGVMMLIQEIRAPSVDAVNVVLALLRIGVTGLLVVIMSFVCAIPGMVIFVKSD